MKIAIVLLLSIFFLSCGPTISKEDVAGCWTVAYIDTDGVKTMGDKYEMCFGDSGDLITRKKDGTQKVEAEWNMEEKDSTIIVHYQGRSFPDTLKIIKAESDEMHLLMKKGLSKITLYLRK